MARQAHMGVGLRGGLALGATLFALVWGQRAMARFQTFHNQTFDLAEYGRLAWGLSRGDGWDPILGTPFAGSHLAFVLAPLGLMGRLFGTVPTLLWAQAIALAVTPLPLAAMGFRRFGPPGALLGALGFWLYPNLGHVASYEFHPGNLALPALALALDALDRERPRQVLICAAAILTCRADFSLLTAMLGLIALQSAGSMRRAGAGLLGLSIAYFAVTTGLQMAHARAEGSAALHFGVWGGSPLGLVGAIFRDPLRVLAHFGELKRLLYPFKILLPLAMLPLLGGRFLLAALPFVAINLISEFPTTTKLYSHYLTPAVPALVAAALHGASRFAHRLPLLSASIGLTLVAGSVLAGGMPWSLDNPAARFVPDGRSEAAARLVGHISDGSSVQAPDFMLPHLILRPRVHRAPPPDRDTDFVALDVSHRRRFTGQEVLLRTSEEPVVRRWLARQDYGLLDAQGDLLLLQRGLAQTGAASRVYSADWRAGQTTTRLSGCLELGDASVQDGTLELSLRVLGTCPSDLALRVGMETKPQRVDLLFDGRLSPAKLLAGQTVRSSHRLDLAERLAATEGRLRIGLLRSGGAPPEPSDPISVPVRLGAGGIYPSK